MRHWRELHAWASQYRRAHNLTTVDLLRLCGLRESLFNRRLLYCGGWATEPSKCFGTDGNALFEALGKLKAIAESDCVDLSVCLSSDRDHTLERCNDVLSEYVPRTRGVMDCCADRGMLDQKIYVDLSVTAEVDKVALCKDIQQILDEHNIGAVDFRIDVFEPAFCRVVGLEAVGGEKNGFLVPLGIV